LRWTNITMRLRRNRTHTISSISSNASISPLNRAHPRQSPARRLQQGNV
jgi:hypothetical protein